MKRSAKLARAAFGLIALASLKSVSAAIIFNNFGPNNTFGNAGRLLQGENYGTIGNVDQAVEFTTGPGSYAVTSVSLGIYCEDPPNIGTGELDVIVASDANGKPGAALGTIPLNINSTGKQIVTANFGGGLNLNANTPYWIIADARTTFDGGWNFNTVNDIGPTAGRSDNGPWSVNPTDTRMALHVEGRAVPEPATTTVALAGGALGMLRIRRRRIAKHD